MLAPAPPSSPPPFPNVFKRVLAALTEKPPAAKPFKEMGVSGTSTYGGYIQTREKSPKWIGQQRYVTIADMAVNASIVAAGVHLFTNLVARPGWTIAPADDSYQAKQVAEFIEEVINGMDQSWTRVVRRASMFRFYGFGVQEWTALKRDDGRVGLRSVEPRPQATIERWAIAEDGTVDGVWQRNPTTGQELGIPRSKMMYLVDDILSDSPEGVGLFRHLAEPWERLNIYFFLEQIGFERDLRGTPIGRIPYAQIREQVKAGDITQAEADALVEAVEKFVEVQVKQPNTAITLDSLPYYSQAADGAKVAGIPQWGLELLQGGSSGQEAISKAIIRTQTEMARVLNAEHLMMGESAGNRSLGESKTDNLHLVANAVLEDIASATERDIVAPICDLNNIPEDMRPKCEPEDVSPKDAEQVASTLVKMAQAGATLMPDDEVINSVRSLMGMPEQAPLTPEMVGMLTRDPNDPNDPNNQNQDDEEEDVEEDEEVEEDANANNATKRALAKSKSVVLVLEPE